VARILLCGDEFHASLAAVRGLHAGGHLPYFATCRPRTYASYSRCTAATVDVPDPDFAPAEYARAVWEAATSLGVDAILPGTESALVVLSRHSAGAPPAVAVGAPPVDTVLKAVDKAAVVELAGRAGLQTPPTRTGTRDELLDDVARFDFPVILKPLRSKLPTGDGTLRYFQAQRIETPTQFERALAEAPAGPWAVQPFLRASLNAIAGVAWGGSLVCTLQQVARRIWPPLAGFSSYAQTVPVDEALEEAARSLVAQFGWSGIFQIQFMRAADGDYFIDFNPRVYGSLALAIAAGRNLPAIWADLLLGENPEVSTYRPDTRYRLEQNDVRAIWRLISTGALGAGARALVPHRKTAHAVFSLRDPGPLRTVAVKAGARLRSTR